MEEKPARGANGENCTQCRFFQGYFNGDCHRHAPVVIDMRTHIANSYPRVDEWTWCGDFEKRPEEKPNT